MQSQQVSDEMLTQVLFGEYYAEAYRLASFLVSDDQTAQAICEQSILMIGTKRHHYWGEISIPALVYEHVLTLSLQSPSLRASTGKDSQGEGIMALERNQALSILLKHGAGLSLEEMATVFGRSKKTVCSLLTKAYKYLIEPSTETETRANHPQARERLLRLAAGDDLAKPEELREHLETCMDCRRFGYEIENLTRQLPEETERTFPKPQFFSEELAAIGLEAHSKMAYRGRGLTLARRSKEALLVGLVIVIIAVTGWLSGAMTPNDDLSTSPAEPQSASAAEAEPEEKEAPPSRSYAGSGLNMEQNLIPDTSIEPGEGYTSFPSINTPLTRQINARGLYSTDPDDQRLSGLVALQETLDYWGWEGSVLSEIPLADDELLSRPLELMDFVNENTDLIMIERFAGDTDLLAELTEAGIPVIIQRAKFSDHDTSWRAQYDIVVGVEHGQESVALASLLVSPLGGEPIYMVSRQHHRYIPVTPAELETVWRPFNFAYYVIYPAERETELKDILGVHFDERQNYAFAAEKAGEEAREPVNQLGEFYGLFNQGTSLIYMGEYELAVEAYEQAAAVYSRLPAEDRPELLLWYQSGPYLAYFHAGRYYDLFQLATDTLQNSGENINLAEPYFWRSVARHYFGDYSGARSDMMQAVLLNPDFPFDITEALVED